MGRRGQEVSDGVGRRRKREGAERGRSGGGAAGEMWALRILTQNFLRISAWKRFGDKK